MSLPALPSYTRAIMSTASDTPKPQVERVEMDRGPAQQRLVNSRVLFNMAVEFLFETNADLNDFVDNWYTSTIGVIGWFTMRHPRTGATVTCRFPSGALGDVTPITGGYTMATVSSVVEYYP